MEKDEKQKKKQIWINVIIGIVVAIVAYIFILNFLSKLENYSVHSQEFIHGKK